MSRTEPVGDPEDHRPGLRLMVYDQTDRSNAWWRPGLSTAWATGSHLYRGMGRLDATKAVSSWEEALHWLVHTRPGERIAQVQYWGHGKWGVAKVDGEPLDIEALTSGHALHPLLRQVADRMLPGRQGLWWFRTCETFGAKPGQRFAQALSDFMGCRTAGHTYIIGHWQSGLHSLLPGETPKWADDEGVREGTPEDPKAAHWSRLWHPNTITFLHGAIPDGY